MGELPKPRQEAKPEVTRFTDPRRQLEQLRREGRMTLHTGDMVDIRLICDLPDGVAFPCLGRVTLTSPVEVSVAGNNVYDIANTTDVRVNEVSYRTSSKTRRRITGEMRAMEIGRIPEEKRRKKLLERRAVSATAAAARRFLRRKSMRDLVQQKGVDVETVRDISLKPATVSAVFTQLELYEWETGVQI
jgi:hypothetical protein